MLTRYALALARLHAATSADDAGTLPAWVPPGAPDVAAFCRFVRALGVPVGGLADELGALVERLRPAAAYRLLHGDPCPGNIVDTGTGVRFLDFEQAALGPGATELAYPRIGFPTCWCATIPAPEQLAEAEAAYRTVLPADGLADACAGWLIRGDALVERARRGRTDRLGRAVRRDWRWGTGTARQRLRYRLGVVAALGVGPELTRVCRALRDRWAAVAPLPATADLPPA